MIQEQKAFCKYKNAHDIETLLHSDGGHQGSHQAHQADKQKHVTNWLVNKGLNYFLELLIAFKIMIADAGQLNGIRESISISTEMLYKTSYTESQRLELC